MRVVVTGGSGRAGRHVVQVLAQAGHQVVNFDLVRAADLPGEFCRVELTDAGETYDAIFQFRPEGVCHLAANPSPGGQARVNEVSLHQTSVNECSGDRSTSSRCQVDGRVNS